MNRIFRIIWSQALNTWVVVSELATRQGKRSSGGAVDECAAPPASTLDRDMIEGSPPVTAWPLRRGIFLALRPRRTARVPVLWHGGLLAAGDDKRGAGISKPLGGGSAEAACTAGDERDLAAQ